MHFILGAFIAVIMLVTGILFTEVFPRWFKWIQVIVGAFSSGYAISILIRKISELTSWYSEPKLYQTALYASLVMLVVIIVVKVVLNKRKSKRA